LIPLLARRYAGSSVSRRKIAVSDSDAMLCAKASLSRPLDAGSLSQLIEFTIRSGVDNGLLLLKGVESLGNTVYRDLHVVNVLLQLIPQSMELAVKVIGQLAKEVG
jgi:hypothetical protein